MAAEPERLRAAEKLARKLPKELEETRSAVDGVIDMHTWQSQSDD